VRDAGRKTSGNRRIPRVSLSNPERKIIISREGKVTKPGPEGYGYKSAIFGKKKEQDHLQQGGKRSSPIEKTKSWALRILRPARSNNPKTAGLERFSAREKARDGGRVGGSGRLSHAGAVLIMRRKLAGGKVG